MKSYWPNICAHCGKRFRVLDGDRCYLCYRDGHETDENGLCRKCDDRRERINREALRDYPDLWRIIDD